MGFAHLEGEDFFFDGTGGDEFVGRGRCGAGRSSELLCAAQLGIDGGLFEGAAEFDLEKAGFGFGVSGELEAGGVGGGWKFSPGFGEAGGGLESARVNAEAAID